ncbi:restriction endonuclease subunit S [Dickeya dadantii]|uniref:restriction endonuclease subunit S n=1 Tax=Dickeya dadantii TaxID=204038 RepID=UPI0003A30AA4|nr:restriction endonuclease subunit S [Dickeya dadantii]
MILQIPTTWKRACLPEVTQINMGQSPDGSTVNESGDGIVFFQGKSEFGKVHPTPRKYCTKPAKIAEEGDILLSVRAPVGPTNIAVQTTAIGRGLAAISAIGGYSHPKFLLYYFRCIEPWLSEQGTGSTFKAISGQFIKQLEIAIPPFSEQKIIAEKLDTLLLQVDSIKAHLDKIPLILKKFRQSVLAAAVSGKLTEDWRGVENPIHLRKLGELASDIRYGTSKKCSKEKGNTPVLRIPNIGMGHIIKDDLKYADFDHKELEGLSLKDGDLLLIRSNGSVELVGKVAVISKDDEKFLFAGYLIRIRLDLGKSVPHYISFCLQSPQIRQTIENIARSTSGVNNINSKELSSLELPIPSMSEQAEIVRRVEQLFAYADGVEKQVQSALERVNNLTQSILAKAFRGELTAQWREENPELISGENSAEALLARIKAERTAQQPQKKTRRKASAAG